MWGQGHICNPFNNKGLLLFFRGEKPDKQCRWKLTQLLLVLKCDGSFSLDPLFTRCISSQGSFQNYNLGLIIFQACSFTVWLFLFLLMEKEKVTIHTYILKDYDSIKVQKIYVYPTPYAGNVPLSTIFLPKKKENVCSKPPPPLKKIFFYLYYVVRQVHVSCRP